VKRASVIPAILKRMILQINPGAADWLTSPRVGLFAIGAIDSLSVLDLIQEMERTFHIDFDYNDMKAVNFRNLLSLTRLLRKKYDLERPNRPGLRGRGVKDLDGK
jgi:hypothetical protein